VAGEENAALTESRDAALRALASEQARRETAEAEVERWKQTALTIQTNLAESHREECRRQWLRGHTEAFEDAATAYDEKLAAAETSLSAALRRAEEAEHFRDSLTAALKDALDQRDALAARAAVAEALNPGAVSVLALADVTEQLTARGEALAKALRHAHRWIIRAAEDRERREKPFPVIFDHACAECIPHGGLVKPGFRCAVHEARTGTGGDAADERSGA
jgi:uncharacterized protein YgbK (DUF1537 family)